MVHRLMSDIQIISKCLLNTCCLRHFIRLNIVGTDCGHPGIVINGTYTGGHSYGDIITYFCYQGFNLTDGDEQRLCQADSNWTGASPTCSSKCLRISLSV